MADPEDMDLVPSPRPKEDGGGGGNGNGAHPPEPETEPEAGHVPSTEDGVALEFARQHHKTLRYVDEWGRWLLWDGTRWKHERTLLAIDLARKLCRQLARALVEADPQAAGSASKLRKAAFVASVASLARSDRRHAHVGDDWDQGPWLLNTPAGTVELDNGGRLRPHNRADLITKITTASPEGECPRWLRFIEEITEGNAELAAYLQRVAGYALTGSTREHALFFFYGEGANGKGTFINTLRAILANFAAVAPFETLVSQNAERHPTDLAMMRGARAVFAQETDETSKWAEAKVKALTGGDPISARFMRQDFFTFTPEFKLIVAANHKPQLANVDEAIRRRFNLVPFNAEFKGKARDEHLDERLKDERGGVLRWCVEGCLDWQAQGLAPPAIVREATEEYLDEQDRIGRFLEECTDRDNPSALEETEELFAAWKRWASANSVPVGTKGTLSKKLSRRLEGGVLHPVSRRAAFRGVMIRRNAYGDFRF